MYLTLGSSCQVRDNLISKSLFAEFLFLVLSLHFPQPFITLCSLFVLRENLSSLFVS